MSLTNKLVQRSHNPSTFAKKYFDRLSDVFNKINTDKLDELFITLEKCRKFKKNIFLIGNGGSSSTAAHMQNDINFDVFKKSKTKTPLRLINLSDNTPSITAIANDLSYEDIFNKQIQIYGNRNDMLLIISASGNSKNLIKAAKTSKKMGIKSFGLLGFDGGVLKKICDNYLLVPSDKGEYGIVEDIHLIINHIISHWFQNKLR